MSLARSGFLWMILSLAVAMVNVELDTLSYFLCPLCLAIIAGFLGRDSTYQWCYWIIDPLYIVYAGCVFTSGGYGS